MILHGENVEHLRAMGVHSVDAVVTDPPYGFKLMGKKWDYDVPSADTWRASASLCGSDADTSGCPVPFHLIGGAMIYRFPPTPDQLHGALDALLMEQFLSRQIPWSEVASLIAQRSPEQVRRMEEERGL